LSPAAPPRIGRARFFETTADELALNETFKLHFADVCHVRGHMKHGESVMQRLLASVALSLMIVAAPALAQSPAMLMSGMGEHHHPIATAKAEAQKYFDQGLVLTFGFNHAEAIRAFDKAHELDPKSPMPLWGKALALGPNYNIDIDPAREKLAHATIEQALKLAANAPERERAYVEAMAVRYSGEDSPDLKTLARDYARAMGELSRRYPDDLDAATLHAESLMNLRPWKLWSLDHQPAEDTLEIVKILESVLARDPNHPGANHLYIHAVEASAHPEWALPSAQRLADLAPGAGHLVHMPSHIYMLVGDYEKAAELNKTAAQSDHAYIEQHQVKGVYPMLYYHHNLHFNAAANIMLGRHKAAQEAAKQLAASVHTHAGDIPEMKMFITEYFSPYPMFVALRFADWQTIISAPQPSAELPLSNGVWRYARGVAFTAMGDIAKAKAEREELAKVRSTIGESNAYGLNAGSLILDIAQNVLDGRMAAAQGDRKAAIGHFEAAVMLQDKVAYNEPPDWYYPVRESLGATLLMDGQAQKAEEVFRTDLQKTRRNARSLFGLWQALLAQGKPVDAELVQRMFEKEWRSSEMPLKLEAL
jgi:tetratricopeptide (TPR) repeat protein